MSLTNWLSKLLAPLVIPVLIASCSPSEDHTGVAADTKMDSLVSVEWLSEHLDDPDLVVLDCTVLIQPDGKGGLSSVSGLAQYGKGHIPTAGFADLMGELSDEQSPLGFAVPAPDKFAAAMSGLGVSDSSRVVLYDAGGSMWAARVWWMLRWIGFDQAAFRRFALKIKLDYLKADQRWRMFELTAERAETDPKVFTRIHAHFVITGHDLSRHHVERAIRLSAEKYCSASIMLGAAANITHDFEIRDA